MFHQHSKASMFALDRRWEEIRRKQQFHIEQADVVSASPAFRRDPDSRSISG
jgi:hypothetical protein